MVLGEGTVRWWWGKHICRAVCKNKLSVTSSALKGGSAGWFVEYFALKLKIFSKIIILANNSLDKHDAETLNPDHSGDSLVLLNWNNRLEALSRSQQLDWLSMLAEMCYGGENVTFSYRLSLFCQLQKWSNTSQAHTCLSCSFVHS